MRGDLQDIGGWRASGGDLRGPQAAISLERGHALFGVYAGEAVRLSRERRQPAARLVAGMALDIADALVAADDWRCAARGASRLDSPLRTLREFTRQVKLLRYG
jgi:hypothetical protein